jgi:hypothetical protein
MRLSLFAAIAGLGLVSAAPPGGEPGTTGATAPKAAAPQAQRSAHGYPPCSRTVRDRCIQLYERGVRTSENLAANRRLGPVQAAGQRQAAAATRGAPVRLAQASHRRCSATVRTRCIQRWERG